MINLPLKVHGGKAYLAKRIVDLMPPHLHYVEPFFGGGAVLLARDPEGVSEVVNDLNGQLINFWTVLQSELSFTEFKRIIEVTPFSEQEWIEAKGWQEWDCKNWYSCVRCAVEFFIMCRQSLAGRMKSFAPLSKRRTRRGMNEQVSAWIQAVDGLSEVHARLRRVVILNRSALEVIRQQDGPETLFYLDPPYLHETRASCTDYGRFEMGQHDHEELLHTLTRIKGRFLLSGYRSKMYDEIAEAYGWNRHDFSVPNNAAGGAEKRRMVECVWGNF